MMLHWSPRSPFVRKVMIAAHELGLVPRLKLRRTVAKMSAPNPDLLVDNPLGKIPTLVLADGTVIVDSGLICDYFDMISGGGKLLPAGGVARYRELSLHELATGLIDVLILWRNERDKPEEKQTQDWLAAFALKTDTALARLEKEIAPVGGDCLSLSQIALGCCLSYMDFRFETLDWRGKWPKLAAWHAAFAARPSAIATEIVDG